MSSLGRIRTITVAALALLSLSAQAAFPLADGNGNKFPSLAPMLEKATPAVVNIATTGTVRVEGNPLMNDPFFRHFFDVPDEPQIRKTQSLGSGVVVDAKNGYIITNNHVIDKADEITVTTRDNRVLKARLIGTDPDTDVAVIQVKEGGLTALPLGDSGKMRVGDFVVAIGNPFGLGQTVTSGIVSALGRSGLGIEGYEDFIQTDASINPGNSGGALVNLKGEIIGVNTAIFSQSGGNIGIGFAIPINMVREVMDQLVKHGAVKRGRLGAEAQDLTPALAQAFNIKDGHGAVITQVSKGSPAAHAGLQPGDIVTAINGNPIRDASTLRNTVGLLRVGETATLTILHEGKSRDVTAKITDSKGDGSQGSAANPHLKGATLSNIEEGTRLYGRIEGVLITAVEPGSPAAAAGLHAGDVIVSANRHNVKSVDELNKVTHKSKTLLLNIRRGNGALFLYLQ